MFLVMSLFFWRMNLFNNTYLKFATLLIPLQTLLIPTVYYALTGLSYNEFWGINNSIMILLLVLTYSVSESLSAMGFVFSYNQNTFIFKSLILIIITFLYEIYKYIIHPFFRFPLIILDVIFVLDMGVGVVGAYFCFFREVPIFKNTLGASDLLPTIAFLNILIVIILAPATLPYGEWLPKVSTLLGIIGTQIIVRARA